MKTPKEDPADRKARELERRKSLLNRRDAAEEGASGLTTDLSAVYGIRGLSMFGAPGSPMAPPATATIKKKRTESGGGGGGVR